NGSSFSHAWTGQETTAATRQGAGHPRHIRIKRSLVEDFAFCDEISFRLGLSVKALNSRATESGSCNHLPRCPVPSFHDVLPLTTEHQHPCFALCETRNQKKRDTKTQGYSLTLWTHRPKKMTMTRTHFSFRVDTWTADGAGAAQTSVFVTVKSCVA